MGEVVHDVLYEDMDRKHRQEREENGSYDHGDYVSEVSARSHLDVFKNVGEGLPAVGDAGLQNVEILLQKNDPGGLLCDVDSGINGDPDVSLLKGCGVVDAVTHIPDGLSHLLIETDHTLFLQRRELGVQVTVLHALLELLVVEGFYLAAG